MPLLSSEQMDDYQRDGFVLIRELFTNEEIGLLGETATNDRRLDQAASSRDDGTGHSVRLSLWNHPGDGIYGMVARCRRMVDRVEELLCDEAYHYHSKMILKDAKVGGAWAWHQDYGYWYQNGLLFPDLCSVMIAVDEATRQNGCLQVLRGSHKMGRVNHVLTGDQAGADRAVVDAAAKVCERVYCELKPGDALFFHPNLLHCSAANESEHSRWALICCYNAKRNQPFKESHHPAYTKLHKVDDAMVLQVGRDESNRARVEYEDLDSGDRSAKSLKDSGR
ncbi:phytanoyl-CoA dioxygenase family protein [Planctomycetes bacterium K23_9]|uniref:Phytanoyl-CoA dioxygenase (PhyH) n=1 Tax=Stieleria marina TaxID=1930275 RepID=A0A517NXH0_9BACT|nr:Phytanoyl-CoA dioxygenase (PhyH) [Planctomycetes bacterium K23_9]